MLNIDKLQKIQLVINEILTFDSKSEFADDDQLSVKIFQMLDMLVHMQTITISIRAELIDKLFSMRPNLRDEVLDQAINGQDNIILFDRRKAHPEGREFKSDLIGDRRSNPYSDRRRGRPDRRRDSSL